MERLSGFGQELISNVDAGGGSVAGILGETVLSGIFIGQIVDLAFLRDMQNQRARKNFKMAVSGLGGLGTAALSLKYGAEAGGLITVFSGISLLLLSQRYLILRVLEKHGDDTT